MGGAKNPKRQNAGRPRALPTATFFCENCGEPVRLKDSVCPNCGRWFSAARCPQCGFVGEPKLFGSGCPACGYLREKNDTRNRTTRRPVPSGGTPSTRRLPGWVYTVTAVFLLLALGLFLVLILRGT